MCFISWPCIEEESQDEIHASREKLEKRDMDSSKIYIVLAILLWWMLLTFFRESLHSTCKHCHGILRRKRRKSTKWSERSKNQPFYALPFLHSFNSLSTTFSSNIHYITHPWVAFEHNTYTNCLAGFTTTICPSCRSIASHGKGRWIWLTYGIGWNEIMHIIHTSAIQVGSLVGFYCLSMFFLLRDFSFADITQHIGI